MAPTDNGLTAAAILGDIQTVGPSLESDAVEPLRRMITLNEGDASFVLRAAGVALHGGRVLLHRAEDEQFWALPGGRSELLEPAHQTLVREMAEELQVEVYPGRLLWVVENFFQFRNRMWHELGLYFLMTFPPDCPILTLEGPFDGDENGLRLIYQWHRLHRLEEISLVPSFLRTALLDLPDDAVYVVHRDRGPQRDRHHRRLMRYLIP